MDPKDLRSEATLGECINNGNSNYTQSTSTSTQTGDRNKTYHDIGCNSLGKVGTAAGRPCAVIGPDRTNISVPQSVSDDYKRDQLPHWPLRENIYQQAPFYSQKSSDLANPQRNISPRQTFQENMQRIMVPPTYTKMNGDHNFLLERSDSIPKIAKSNETPKYCDVPYTVNPISCDQKTTNSCEMPLPNVNSAYLRPQNHGWQQNSVIGSHPQPLYGSPDLYQYNDYTSCAVPPNMPYARPQRLSAEEAIPGYAEHYYRGRNIRFEPYPPAKDRYPPPRYDYINRYPSSFQPPSFPSHKFEMQKLPPSYPTHMQGTYIRDPALDGYQRNTKHQINFNVPFPNQGMSSKYSAVPANSLPNKYYPYPDPSLNPSASVQGTYDQRTKLYVDHKGIPPKAYPASQNYYMNELPRHMTKAQTVPNYSSNVHPLAYYRKDMISAKASEFLPTLKTNDAVYYNSSSRQHTSNMIGPYDTQINNGVVPNHQYRRLPEDSGYAPQAHAPVFRNMNPAHHPMYNNYDPRFGPMMSSHMTSKFGGKSKGVVNEGKKNIDVRQFLESWSVGDDEGNESGNNGKEIIIQTSSNFSKQCDSLNNQEQLYVLGLVNVPSEELSKYEHIQKVSKLPDNIKGYTNIDLLNQFEEAIESSKSNGLEMSASKNGNVKLRPDLPGRPVSPFDVEAKISQSVIHKDVGCNFEIRPCSPSLVNVQVAVPARPLSGERTIEKVSNPVNIESKTCLPVANKNMDSKPNNETIALNDDLNVSSCGKANISEVKLPYSMHDLESNSGVCFASLPRLDNDIELNFPEVNQQFINANKQECVSLAKITELCENQTLSESNETCSTKDYPKLIKYRKSKCAENEPHTVPIRIDSVIKNNVSILENISYDANQSLHPSPQTDHNAGKTHPFQNSKTSGDALNLTVSSTLGSVIDKIELNKPEILSDIALEKDLNSAPSIGNALPSYRLCSNKLSSINSVLADNSGENSDKRTCTDNAESFSQDNPNVNIQLSVSNSKLADDLDDNPNKFTCTDMAEKNKEISSQVNSNDKIQFSPSNSVVVDDLGDTVNHVTPTDSPVKNSESSSQDNPNDNSELTAINSELAYSLGDNSNKFACTDMAEKNTENSSQVNSNDKIRYPCLNSVVAYDLGDTAKQCTRTDNFANNNVSSSQDNSNDNSELTPINSELAYSLGDNSNKFTCTDMAEKNTENSSQVNSIDKFPSVHSVLAEDLGVTSNEFISTDTVEKNNRTFIEVNSKDNIQQSLMDSELADALGVTSNKFQCTDTAEMTKQHKAMKIKEYNEHFSQVSNSNVQDDIPETNDSIREYIENSSAMIAEYIDGREAIVTQLNDEMCSNSKNNNKCDDIFVSSKQSSLYDECDSFTKKLEGIKNLEDEDFHSDEKCFEEVHNKNTNVTEDSIAETKQLFDEDKQLISCSPDEQNLGKIDKQLYGSRDSEHCCMILQDIEKSFKIRNRFWGQRMFSPVIQNLLFNPYKHFVLFRNMDNFIENSSANEHIQSNLKLKVMEPNVEDFVNNDSEDAENKFPQDKDTKIKCENIPECPEVLVDIADNLTELASKVINQENKQENFIAKKSAETLKEELSEEPNPCLVSEKNCRRDKTALNEDVSETGQSCQETEDFSPALRPRILKRSLSESALSLLADKNSQYVTESSPENPYINPSKRKRQSEEGETHIILDNNFGRVFHINRRNSISALCEDNVSFCIMIDDNCLVAEENDFESGTICFANIDETNIESNTSEMLDVQTKSPSELDNNPLEDKNSYVSCAEEDEEENWVEDIACVETVVSDETDYNNHLSPTSYSDTVGNKIDVIVNNTINESKEIFYNENSCFTHALYANHSLSENTGDEVVLVNESSSGVKKNCIEELLSSSDSSLEGFDRNLIETGDSFDIFKEDVSSLIEDMTKEHLRKANYVEDVPSLIECKSPLVPDNMTSIFSSQFISETKSYPTTISDEISNCLSSSSNFKRSSSSPEVTSTTSDDKKGILLKITKHNGAKTLEVNDAELCSSKKIRCKFTENEDYLNSRIDLPVIRPLITKAAQKYIPPLKETIGDLKVKLRLPKDSLIKLRKLKHSKSLPSEISTFKDVKDDQKLSKPNVVTKQKPKFEDVLKSIDEFQLKTSKDRLKKVKNQVPKVIIKKTENGSHYASRSNKDLFNPDLTGRKWQPWVFIEKNRFIDKMALRGKRSAVYCHRKKTFILKEKFRKYRSVNKYNTEFVISKKNESFSSCPLKYTIRLKKTN